MITFKMLGKYGRLGNQLFQIASTIGYAKKYGQKYDFPEWSYEKDFNTSFNHTQIETHTLLRESSEVDYVELPGYFPGMGNVEIFGYLQSEKYFENAKKEILNIFKTEETNLNSGAIHVRRGDYTNLQNYHPLQSLEYYKKGMDELGFDHYYCFSDDIQWCKENLIDSRIEFVENTSEIQDLKLMSRCKGAVIANSSFSWWGAYLGNHNNVIIPRNWFGPSISPYKIEDRVCKGWKIL